MRRFTAFAEDDLQFAAPVFGERDEFPLDFRREIAKYRLIGGMNSQRGRGERDAGWVAMFFEDTFLDDVFVEDTFRMAPRSSSVGGL